MVSNKNERMNKSCCQILALMIHYCRYYKYRDVIMKSFYLSYKQFSKTNIRHALTLLRVYVEKQSDINRIFLLIIEEDHS